MHAWLPILGALAGTPSTSVRLDLVVASMASRLEATAPGTVFDGPTHEEARELDGLCALGVEVACRFRVSERGWDGVDAYADGPCLPSVPCPPADLVLRPEGQVGGWDGLSSEVHPTFAEVLPSVEEGPLSWLPNGQGSHATCALDGTMHVAAPGRYRFTGVRCGAFRWGPGGDILWVHTRGSLVAVEPESGTVHRWLVAGRYPQPSPPRVSTEGEVWLQPLVAQSCANGLGRRTPDHLDGWTERIPAQSAPGMVGLWRGARGRWMWVGPEVGQRAAQHGPLVVVDGRLLVLRGEQLRIDASGEVWKRVPVEASPFRLVGEVGRAGSDLASLPSSVSVLPRGAAGKGVWLWTEGGPFSASVTSRRTGCASGPCEVFRVVSHWERSLHVEGSLRHYPDGRWVFSGRSCPRADERRPTQCGPVELEWRSAP